ncbi:MAG: D-3-phosphoglycerate dehydrogenase (EC [uncultured Caballeronia sp.]|nr:MAG: D-3-phosphoglycerate dehydrogenase (EC [uncultured Caballeronia sp.]
MRIYKMHRLFEHDDKDAYIREHGASIRGVITGGHTGISNELIERLPALAGDRRERRRHRCRGFRIRAIARPAGDGARSGR